MEKKINHTTVTLKKGDIADLEIDAFVFYARHDLALGSGFGTAIAGRGGPAIKKELEKLGTLGTCDSVVTAAGDMKAKHIVHAVGPRFQEQDTEAKLKKTIENSLKKAEEAGIKRLAFPAMGTGFYGVPLDTCARILVDTIKVYLMGSTQLEEVTLCLNDAREYKAFEAKFSTL
ncbi:MAG: macro domain-containing protein [Candidatus Riflebacteria bacterium]|nr:macro domain-containing protein [Candidatus Riflebacteria bacterium]